MPSTSTIRVTVAALLGAWCPGVVQGQIVTYSDRAAFAAATGAQPEPEWPNVGHIGGASFHSGRVTLSVSAPSSGFWIGTANDPRLGPDWTTLVPGHDIAVDGQEYLNAAFDLPVTAAGFDFAEPTTATVVYNPCSIICPCANSTFRVTLLHGGTPVATFDFNRPDNLPSFVGVSSAAPFDRLEIRELGGTCDDEYFGRFYLACAAPTVAVHPQEATICPNAAAEYSAQGAGAGTLTYQWRYQWGGPSAPFVDVAEGLNTADGGTSAFLFEGSRATTGRVRMLVVPDYLRFACAIANACGMVETTPAAMLVRPTCDYNDDGGADNSDVTDLANDIASGTQTYPHCTADFNDDGGADNSDVTDLANAIAAGTCP